MKNPAHYPLAVSKVAYVGDGVACVLAETDSIAHDAIERSTSTTTSFRR